MNILEILYQLIKTQQYFFTAADRNIFVLSSNFDGKLIALSCATKFPTLRQLKEIVFDLKPTHLTPTPHAQIVTTCLGTMISPVISRSSYHPSPWPVVYIPRKNIIMVHSAPHACTTVQVNLLEIFDHRPHICSNCIFLDSLNITSSPNSRSKHN